MLRLNFCEVHYTIGYLRNYTEIMKYPIYKPNKNCTGAAGSFAVTKFGKDQKTNLFVELLLQKSWDDKKRTGSFNPEKKVTFKLSLSEAGEILSSLKTRIPFTAFHKFGEDTTVINMTPWDKAKTVKTKDGDKKYTTPAWGLKVTRNSSETYKLPLEAGEAEVLAAVLTEFIQQVLLENSAIDAQNRAKAGSESPKAGEKEEDDVPF